MKKLDVKNIGVVPKSKTEWAISKKKKDYVRCERAQVDGVIGTIKNQKYGFNKTIDHLLPLFLN